MVIRSVKGMKKITQLSFTTITFFSFCFVFPHLQNLVPRSTSSRTLFCQKATVSRSRSVWVTTAICYSRQKRGWIKVFCCKVKVIPFEYVVPLNAELGMALEVTAVSAFAFAGNVAGDFYLDFGLDGSSLEDLLITLISNFTYIVESRK